MALIDEIPTDIPGTNALDDIPDDLLATPAAFLKFGASPAAMVDPPAYGDKVTYVVRARCTAEHGPIERKDGEQRYERTMAIQAVWLLGDPAPPDPDEEQPALFDQDGGVPEGDGQWEYEQGEPAGE